MDIALIIARILHVGAGVFWAGAIFFISRFLNPAVAEAGPAGGQVMQAIAKRGITAALPVSAVIAIVAGIYLFYRTSAGFDNVYMGSGPGITYSIGGTAAILALIIGGTMVRGPIEKMMKLGATLGSAPESERGAMMAEMNALRQKSSGATRMVSILLMITVFCMAIGRYV